MEMQEDVEEMSDFPWVVRVRRKNGSWFYAL